MLYFSDIQRIVPHLWFNTDAVEAANFYASVFGGKAKSVNQLHDTPSGDVDTVTFELRDLPLMAISAGPYFKFNPSISFMVNFDPSQEPDAEKSIDIVWEKLSAVKEAEQCGWLKDKFGVSWQIVPKEMDEMMEKGTPEQKERVTKAFLQMKKFDLAELKRAYEGS